jgi:hypothetical protein
MPSETVVQPPIQPKIAIRIRVIWPANSERFLHSEASKEYPGNIDKAEPERIQPIEHRIAQVHAQTR